MESDHRADVDPLRGNLGASGATQVCPGLSQLVPTVGTQQENSKTSLYPALDRPKTQLQHAGHFEEHAEYAGFDVASDAPIANANSQPETREFLHQLHEQVQIFRHEVGCLEDVRAESASEVAKQKQELRLLQSEEQMQQRAWESQNAALQSQVSWLQEATAQRKVQARELQDQLQLQKQMLEETTAQFRHEARCLDEARAMGRDTAAEQRLELRVLQSEEQMQRSAWESRNAAQHSEISVLQEANAQRDARACELQGQLHKQEQTAEEADVQFRKEVRCLEDAQAECANKAAEQMQEMRVVQSEASQNASLHSEISVLLAAKAQRDVRLRESQGQLHKQEQTAEEAFRHEVRCLEDVRAQCANKAAEQRQEMRVLQSEGQLQRSTWESQNAALRSQVSGLQEAIVQPEAQARELQNQLQTQKEMLEETNAQFRHKARCLDEVRAMGRDTAAEQRLELRVLQTEEQMQRSAWESRNATLHSEILVLQEAKAQQDARARELQGQLRKKEQMAEGADVQFRKEVRCLEDAQAECATKAAEQMQEMRVVQSEGQLQRSAWESQNAALRSQVSGLQEAIVQREAHARELQDQLQLQKQMLEETTAQFRHEARCLDEARAMGRDTAAEQRLELRVLQSEEQMQRSAWESRNAAQHSEISVLQEANAQRDARACELQGQLHKQEQTAEEADVQFRKEVRCLEDAQAECANKAAEQMQEMRVVQSEGQLQRSAWASQNAALHSEISGLREAKAERDARACELQGQLHKQESTAEEADMQFRKEVRCLEDAQAECATKAAEQMQEMRVVQSEGQLQRSAWESQNAALRSQVSGLQEALGQRDIQVRELEAALLQAEAHAAEQKGQFLEQHHSLEVAEVQLHKLEMCEATESRTKHQHMQAESRVLSVECQELNTRWLVATETIECLELDTQKLESQAESFRAEADAYECLVKSQLRLEREESTYKQALAASRADSYEQEEEDLCHMRLEHNSAQMQQEALESQNEALQSWCSSLQEQNLQLQSVRAQDEMRWLSECRETHLLRQRLLEANELQAGASGREPTLCEEVNCLREANAAFEGTVGEIKCRHRQMQAESERRRSECEELTASWLSACEEVDSMRLGMWQLKAQVENAQKKSEQLVVDCKALKKERAESQEQSARLQLHVRQCRAQLAALQQEVVMEGLNFVRPDSQVRLHQAERAARAYELQDQLQTDRHLSEEVQAAEQLRRLSRQSIWGPAT